jgi:hypothetical protein
MLEVHKLGAMCLTTGYVRGHGYQVIWVKLH